MMVSWFLGDVYVCGKLKFCYRRIFSEFFITRMAEYKPGQGYHFENKCRIYGDICIKTHNNCYSR